jgi:hypothetical protein
VRRISTIVSVLFAAVSTFLFSAQAAFAQIVAPPAGAAGPATAAPITHHSGLYPWQIGVIIAAGVVVLAVVAAIVFRLTHRAAPRPALP